MDLLRDLLARGGIPDAGWNVMDEALRSVSVDRNTTAVFEAIVSEDPALVELLLQAGARLDSPWSSTTPLAVRADEPPRRGGGVASALRRNLRRFRGIQCSRIRDAKPA